MPDQIKAATALSFSEGASTAPQDLFWLEQNIPCQVACPAGTDIPAYLEAVYHGRFAEAYEINLRDNVFPAVLGRVCSRPCENACRHGREGNGEAVAICFSKRSAADFTDTSPVILEPLFPSSRKHVAIVGAGVAGLAVARDLALFGHRVSVYEKHSRPGGMLNQGIPAFRLPRDVIARELEQITALGVEIHCGVAVGHDVSSDELLSRHDALVLAAGTLRPNVLGLPGEKLAGVEHGLRFLLEVNEKGRRSVGQQVVVVGGGYTAMDCARTAVRLGAQTAVFYRRGRGDMVVLPGEVEELLAEGSGLNNQVAPLGFEGGDQVSGVQLVRTEPGEPGTDGRRLPREVPGSEFLAEADSVILATGQFPDTSWLGETFKSELLGDDGWLKSGTACGTANTKVFAAGDFALGATTLIEAIGHARKSALAVDEYLTGRTRVRTVAKAEKPFLSKTADGRTTGRAAQMNVIPIHPMPVLPLDKRVGEVEVETGYDSATATEAASRCYLCHYKFEIIDSKCVLCDECLKVKPVPGCIVEVADLQRDQSDRITGYRPVQRDLTDSLYYNRLWIDQDQCVRCGQCEAVCPVNAITIQKVSLTRQPV
ncbi:MAG: FAD-dependent oxidoreductase [Betaproteobacteria bacterium]|nr:MAG: FAD-dependent oxidoreductase [Betaproteobacteria bacterium]